VLRENPSFGAYEGKAGRLCPWRTSHPAEADSLHARHTMGPTRHASHSSHGTSGHAQRFRCNLDLRQAGVHLPQCVAASPYSRQQRRRVGDATSRHTRVYPSPTRPSAADVVVPRVRRRRGM